MAYERIVVGTDGSAGSKAAAGWAARVAAHTGAKVTLVYGLAPLLEHMFSIPPLRSEELMSLASDELSGSWSEPFRQETVGYETVVVEDGAAAAVLSTAERSRASLVVLGRHGHTRWAPHTMGGVAHKVLSHATCPIVIVPTSWEGGGMGDSRDVVVGVDGSESSLAALDWAIDHAEAFGLGVRAVTAVHTQPTGDITWLAPTDDDHAHKLAEEELRDIVEERMAETDVDIVMRVILGYAGGSLVGESATAGLLVVGCRGLGSVAALLTGSTSHYVVTRSLCPAVVVP